MKKVMDFLEEYFPMMVILGLCGFMYKVAVGVYHLLDKLIDKI
jgi:hypothetical protein